ncbi:ParA family protein, partial [Mycobacterium tuberculosis]|nr:ParA family protein [Mycobacterium tuberculosis]
AVELPPGPEVKQAAMAQTSIQKIDRSSKVAREFRKLAVWVANELYLKTDNSDVELQATEGVDDE